MDNRSRASIWFDAAYRYSLITFGSKVIPLLVVTEFPKSGGTWGAQMIADLAQVPFPRNEIFFPKKSMLHTHLCYSKRIANVVCVFRDGRDVMVSLYYHNLFESEKNSPVLVRRLRNSLKFADYDDIQANLPEFIEFMHHRQAAKMNPYRFTWGEFIDSWLDRQAVIMKYESLLLDPFSTLKWILQDLNISNVPDSAIEQTVDKYSFQNQSKRMPGEEDTRSFLRKGISGDWKNKFTPKASRIFNELYGKQLIHAGYERNLDWIGSNV